MLIINGVNVYPSQVEHIIANTDGVSLNYQIIAEKKGFLDSLKLVVELDGSYSEEMIQNIKKRLEHSFLNNLYVNAVIIPVKPGSIERSMGKAVRVVDKRR